MVMKEMSKIKVWFGSVYLNSLFNRNTHLRLKIVDSILALSQELLEVVLLSFLSLALLDDGAGEDGKSKDGGRNDCCGRVVRSFALFNRRSSLTVGEKRGCEFVVAGR